MLESHKIFLQDRIKETSYTIGTGSFVLNGASNGFSSFGSAYINDDNLFYAATDGTFYEVGSGVYVTGIQNSLIRFPFKSSNNNAIVSFGEGIKEIFVTYPATNSVYSASGLQGNLAPKQSGIAYWSSSNILNYDNNLIWDETNNRLGILKHNPEFSIDIGGSPSQSIIRSSGVQIGSIGVIFPSGNNGDSSYIGGTQLAHYEPNSLNTLTGSNQVLELSGVAKNNILFKQQNAGLVFAGPASGCTPPCSPDYPSFRQLIFEDIRGLSALSGVTFNTSGVLRNDLSIVSGIASGSSGVLRNDLSIVSGIATNFYKTSFNNNFNPSSLSGLLRSSYTASGTFAGAISLLDTTNSSQNSQYGYALYTTSSGTNLNIGIGTRNSSISNILNINTNNNGNINTSILDFYGQKLRIRNSFTPTSPSGDGNTGDICWDNNYIYVCISPNTWKRTSVSTWS